MLNAKFVKTRMSTSTNFCLSDGTTFTSATEYPRASVDYTTLGWATVKRIICNLCGTYSH